MKVILAAAVILSTIGTAGQSQARPRYVAAFWRELGYHENHGGTGLFVRVWVSRADGSMLPNIAIVDQNGVQFAVTDSNGRATFDLVNQVEPIRIKATDSKGHESDFTPLMTRWHYPHYGCHSYEALFILKDEAAPGVFDTRLYGTVNLTDETDTDAPCTRSLAYYSTDPLNAYSDSFVSTTWAASHGQTFVPDGDRVRAIMLHGIVGGTDGLTFSVDVMTNGPNGTVIASKTFPNHSSIDPWLVVFGENECPVTPGVTHYIRMTRSGGLSAYASAADVYPHGTYFVNGIAVPGQDIKGLVCCEKTSPSVTATFAGSVKNHSGQPVPGAVVSVSPGYRKATSGADGTFVIGGLLPGEYVVKAVRPGYANQEIIGLSAEEGQTTVVDFGLVPLSANVLENPGFETGSMPPWTAFGQFGGVYASGSLNVPSHGGTYHAGRAVQNQWGTGGLLQTVDVTPGAWYTASCWLYTDSYAFLRLYEYPTNCTGRIGLDPAGGTNAQAPTVVWSPMAHTQTSWAPIQVSALASGPKMTVFGHFWQTLARDYNVVVYDDFHLGSDNLSGRIVNALAAADGSAVSIYGQICSASTAEIGGAFYAQEPDRTRGIRVETSESVQRGQVVSVRGTLRTAAGERTLTADSIAVVGSADTPQPLGVRLSALVRTKPPLAGLLARTWGQVTAKGSGYVTISDGSSQVNVHTDADPPVHAYITATGVVGSEPAGGSASVTVIRCREVSDLTILP